MDIRIPQLAEGTDSGTVVSVLVKPGDTIQKDQPLIEIESKKAVAPIPSPEGGVVQAVHVKEGQEVAVGQVAVSLAKQGAKAASAEPAPQARAAAAEPAPAAPPAQRASAPVPSSPAAGNGTASDYKYESKSGVPPPASPTVRKLARDLGIDLTRVRGTEGGGRISMTDVRSYIEHLQEAAFSRPAAAESAPAAKPKPATSVDFAKWGPVVKKPMTPLRKVISRRMVESWTSVPHVTQFDEADSTVISELRKKHLDAFEKKGARLTLTSFIIKAVADTLKKHESFNASLDEALNEIVFKQYVHIGIAVDTEQGLMVPVLRDADKKSLGEISKELANLAERTRSRKLSSDEMEGGSFTISNQGGLGGAHFTPIINRPEVAILGVGQGKLKPVVAGKKIEPRTLIPLGLSYDHRVIDGGSAARFIKDLVQAIETFDESQVKV